jgi:tetrahydromethanopterin S-methyltransferase subunit C
VVGFGVGSFGLISLGLGWFESVEGVAGPVTDLGYGALVGIILTVGLLVQLRAPEGRSRGCNRPLW